MKTRNNRIPNQVYYCLIFLLFGFIQLEAQVEGLIFDTPDKYIVIEHTEALYEDIDVGRPSLAFHIQIINDDFTNLPEDVIIVQKAGKDDLQYPFKVIYKTKGPHKGKIFFHQSDGSNTCTLLSSTDFSDGKVHYFRIFSHPGMMDLRVDSSIEDEAINSLAFSTDNYAPITIGGSPDDPLSVTFKIGRFMYVENDQKVLEFKFDKSYLEIENENLLYKDQSTSKIEARLINFPALFSEVNVSKFSGILNECGNPTCNTIGNEEFCRDNDPEFCSLCSSFGCDLGNPCSSSCFIGLDCDQTASCTDCIDNVCAPPLPLPLNLIDFSINTKDCFPFLKWTTESEVNVEALIVERQIDMKWVEVARIDGKNESINEYTYHDLEARGINKYYRLRFVDLDGTYEFSKIVGHYSDCNKEEYFRVYPTIVTKGTTQMHYALTGTGPISFALTVAGGEVIWQDTYENLANVGFMQFDFTSFTSGSYFLSIYQNYHLIKTERVVVRH